MRRPSSALILIVVLLATAAQAATNLEWIGSSPDDDPLDWSPWFDDTVVVTAGGIRLLDWTWGPGERAIDLRRQAFHDVRMVTFGDSLFIDQPGDLDGFLLSRDSSGTIAVRTRGSAWHLASNRIDGQSWYVEFEASRLLVYPAPGEQAAVGEVDVASSVRPHDQAVTDGDRAVVARQVNGQTRVQIIDLSDPTEPIAGQVITHDETGWIAVRGRTLVVAGSLLRTYDISDPDAPTLLFELGPGGQYSRPTFRDDGILAVWRDRDIRLVDASDPSDLRPGATVPAVLPPNRDPWLLQLGTEHLVTRGDHGLHGYELMSGHYVLLDVGVGWWRPEGSLLVTDGDHAYLQGDRRYVLDLHGVGGQIDVLGAVETSSPGAAAFLGLTEGHLIYADGSNAVVIDDVSQPLVPSEAAVIALAEPVRAASLEAPYLSLITTDVVDLYDVSNPANPQHAGNVTQVAHPTRLAMRGDLLFILDHVNGTDDRIHIVDLSIPGPPPIVAEHDFAGDGWLHRVVQMTCRGDDLLAQVARTQGGSVETYTLRLDVTDPTAPVATIFDQQHYFWGDWSQPPQDLVGFHVTVEVNNLYLNDYDDDPVTMPVLDILGLPSRIRAVATHGNELVALHDRYVVRCTVSGAPPVAAPTVEPTLSFARAVPNPFNPRTTITFALPIAGEVSVAIHDLRGRCVRTLAAQLPAGPASVVWTGTDDQGRALPSGVYLVRVSGARISATTRCALVR